MRAKVTALVLFFFCGTGVAVSQAEIVFSLRDASGVPTTDFEIVGVGGTVDVQIYLTDTDGALGVLDTEGLGSIDFEVSEEVTSPDLFHVSSLALSSEFDPEFLKLTLQADSTKFAPASLLGTSSSSSIYLTTLTFTGDSLGTSVITATGADNVTTGLGTELESVGPALGSISVVPEPSSLLLLTGLLGVVGAGTLYRRRRKDEGRHVSR
ncbi:MAG: PEP-CTERM sorting domain-containing protein [Planctomycetota bacterium]